MLVKWAQMLIIIHALIPAISCYQNSSVISVKVIVISEHETTLLMVLCISCKRRFAHTKRWILRIAKSRKHRYCTSKWWKPSVWPLGCIIPDLWVHKWFTLFVSKADGPYDSCRFYCRAQCVITIDHTIHVTTHFILLYQHQVNKPKARWWRQ